MCLFLLGLFVKVNPVRIQSLTDGVSKALLSFPSNVSIVIENGHMTSNLDMPYFTWMGFEDNKILLLVIDEKNTVNRLKLYKPLVMLTGTEMAITSGSSIKRYPYPLHTTFQINQATMLRFEEAFRNYFKKGFALFYPLFIVVTPLFFALANTVYLVFSSVIVFVFFRLFHRRFSLKKIFQIGMHACTLPFLIGYCILAINHAVSGLPFVMFVLLFIFHLTGVYEAYYEEVPQQSHGAKSR